jgi:hypothetical protein
MTSLVNFLMFLGIDEVYLPPILYPGIQRHAVRSVGTSRNWFGASYHHGHMARVGNLAHLLEMLWNALSLLIT